MNKKMNGNQNVRIRYDEAFKQGAINMIVEQKMPLKKVSAEFGVSTDSLSTWLRNANYNLVKKFVILKFKLNLSKKKLLKKMSQ